MYISVRNKKKLKLKFKVYGRNTMEIAGPNSLADERQFLYNTGTKKCHESYLPSRGHIK